MGATVQRTRYDAASKKILTDDGPSVKPVNGQQRVDEKIQVVAGWDILSNNQVRSIIMNGVANVPLNTILGELRIVAGPRGSYCLAGMSDRSLGERRGVRLPIHVNRIFNLFCSVSISFESGLSMRFLCSVRNPTHSNIVA